MKTIPLTPAESFRIQNTGLDNCIKTFQLQTGMWANDMTALNNFPVSFALVILYAVVINALTFLAYGLDKALAKKGVPRISERLLLILALIGGTVGAIIGLKIWQHKTRKRSFKLQLFAILVFQIILGAAFLISAPNYS